MSSKSGPGPTEKRKKVVIDYCDKEFERGHLQTAKMQLFKIKHYYAHFTGL